MNGLVIVNRAAWNPPEPVPDGWVIANAPRPIQGRMTWQGPFAHGIFYAASPEIPEGTFGWKADDAYLVEFTDNATIEQAVMAKLAEHGYKSLDELDLTMAEFARYEGHPWHEETAR